MSNEAPHLFILPGSAQEAFQIDEVAQQRSAVDVTAIDADVIELIAASGSVVDVALETAAHAGLIITNKDAQTSSAELQTLATASAADKAAVTAARTENLKNALQRRALARIALEIGDRIYTDTFTTEDYSGKLARTYTKVDTDKVEALFDATEQYDDLPIMRIIRRVKERRGRIDADTGRRLECIVRLALSGAVDNVVQGLHKSQITTLQAESISQQKTA